MFEGVLKRLNGFSQVFHLQGYVVYLVGGAVRNLLLGLPAKDFDFATDATPEEVSKLFRRVVPTGIKHGTVTVLFEQESYEVTTFRIDGAYKDHRHPGEVNYTRDLAADLGRRDFTINGMALDLSSGVVVDLYGGKKDLKAGLIRAIGDPFQRFSEDALRILRLFRFAAQYGFLVEEKTRKAAEQLSPNLASVSRERIRDEFLKTIGARASKEVWSDLQRCGILKLILTSEIVPDLSASAFTSWERLDPHQRVSFWLAHGGVDSYQKFSVPLKLLKLSNNQLKRVLMPLRALPHLQADSNDRRKAKLILFAWENRQYFSEALKVLEALREDGLLKKQAISLTELRRAATSAEPVFLSELAVTGEELRAAGVLAGPLLGTLLRRLLELVWEEPLLNEKASLLKLIYH